MVIRQGRYVKRGAMRKIPAPRWVPIFQQEVFRSSIMCEARDPAMELRTRNVYIPMSVDSD